jgi:hypothetical protein
MRRIAVAIIAIGSVLALSACSLPPGVDGNLVDDWTSIAAPLPAMPIVGDCYGSSDSDMLGNPPVACTSEHVAEVAYIGAFAGADASRVTVPPAGSTTLRSAYAKCQAPVKTFLGADWHSGLLQLDLVIPDAEGWTGGARWFRCDVALLSTPDGETIASNTSLKGSLAPGKNTAATLQCVLWTDHKTYITDIHKSSCAKPFNGEYAGFFTAPDTSWPSTAKKRSTLTGDGCADVVARYLGFNSVDDENQFDVGSVNMPFDEDRWDGGDRTVRCFAAADTKDGKFTASVKGIRGKTPKG